MNVYAGVVHAYVLNAEPERRERALDIACCIL